ncbi:MAG: hypothetical protein RBS48_11860 [Ignavibacteriaceae bacterium]|nr:hypothetical protein [Ignavibacteriaceae bacterium]
MKKLLFILCLLISVKSAFGQASDNNSLFIKLLQESAEKSDSLLQSNFIKTFDLKFDSNERFQYYGSILNQYFLNKGYQITQGKEDADNKLLFNLINFDIKYGEPEKESFFGDLLIKRNMSLKTVQTLNKKDSPLSSITFNAVKEDTLLYDEASEFENSGSFPVRNHLPSAPIFSNLLEPILAVGSIGIVIILFFTVRSN